MTARSVPEVPDFASDAERVVWERLREQLPDDAVLFANRRFTDADGDCEADLLVAWPDVGFVVVEVKGGHVSLDRDGRWHQSGKGGDHGVDPVRQAQRCRYALRGHLDGNPTWTGGRIRTQHLVAFPYSRVAPDVSTSDCPRWMVLDRDDVTHLARRLADAVDAGADRSLPTPGTGEVAQLVDCLVGRPVAQRDHVAGEVEARGAAVDLLTQRQAAVLDHISLLPRVEVRGGAGSGKTWLAVEQARRFAADKMRVALLSYSRGLAMYLRERCDLLSARQRPAYVGTFHGLGLEWGAKPGADDDPVYWEDELPRAMTALAADLPDGERFDALVVDEGQDFDDTWWPALLAGLREPGRLVVFADEGQRVFARAGRPPVDLVPIPLDENLRNTRQIAQAFSSLVPTQQRIRGGDGEAVRFVPCSSEDALDTADEMVDELLERVGYEPHHVALLTTGRRHPVQREGQEEGHDVYWRDFFDARSTFYGHVLGFKGLERPVVVLAVNGFGSGDGAERAREKLYVGLSRARDLLVVCGDPRLIRSAGGDGVARRLGIR
ncbi:NERD domain-containing protein [Aquipuribacter hungaricus]|uniref:NERD domain-containing protein n=1 Tax=Aquipuribacter hungaricus TaxID=545624 RepID=A0ABV7WI55_9MICO